MEVTAVGGVVIALAPFALFSARAALALLGATIPLSAAAALILGWGGGASAPLSVVAALALIARQAILGAGPFLRGKTYAPPGAAWLLGFLCIALVGAALLPRLFEGATLVYPLDRTVSGVVGGVMKFPLAPLAPGAGAVTQGAYLTGSALLFLAVASAARRDPAVMRIMLWAATASHLAMAAADASGAGWIDLFRTANYQIAAGQSLAGFTRLTGGAPEPSVFGATAAALAAWHLWSFRAGGRSGHAAAGAAMAMLAAASVSSTALAALGALGAVMLVALARERRIGALAISCFAAAIGVAAAGWLAAGPYGAAAEAAFNALFIDKWSSESGLERAAWARQAITNFIETGGLGVGLGASRASGWITAVLGQTGLPGAVLLAGFLLRFAGASGDGALRAAAAATLFAALLSASRVDLGFLFFALAGGAVASARQAAAQEKEEATCARYYSTASS